MATLEYIEVKLRHGTDKCWGLTRDQTLCNNPRREGKATCSTHDDQSLEARDRLLMALHEAAQADEAHRQEFDELREELGYRDRVVPSEAQPELEDRDEEIVQTREPEVVIRRHEPVRITPSPRQKPGWVDRLRARRESRDIWPPIVAGLLFLVAGALVALLILFALDQDDENGREVRPPVTTAETGTIAIPVANRSGLEGVMRVTLYDPEQKRDIALRGVRGSRIVTFDDIPPGEYFVVTSLKGRSAFRAVEVTAGETVTEDLLALTVNRKHPNRVLADGLSPREKDVLLALPAVRDFLRRSGLKPAQTELVLCKATASGVPLTNPDGTKTFHQRPSRQGEPGVCVFRKGQVPQANFFASERLVGFVPLICANIGKPGKPGRPTKARPQPRPEVPVVVKPKPKPKPPEEKPKPPEEKPKPEQPKGKPGPIGTKPTEVAAPVAGTDPNPDKVPDQTQATVPDIPSASQPSPQPSQGGGPAPSKENETAPPCVMTGGVQPCTP